MKTDKVKPVFTVQKVVPYNGNKKFEQYLKPSFSSSAASLSYLVKSRKAVKRKSKASYIRSWFMENFRNFCNTTSLHGFNYITRLDLSKNERLFWFIITIISIIVSISLVMVSYVWNGETPTVTVIESSHYPTWNIPFPAVTLCNFNKISKTKALNMAKAL